MSKRFTITSDTDIDTIAAAALANQLTESQIKCLSAEAKVVVFFALVNNDTNLVTDEGWFTDTTRNLLKQLVGAEDGQLSHLIATLNKSGLFVYNGERGTESRHRLNLEDEAVERRSLDIISLQATMFPQDTAVPEDQRHLALVKKNNLVPDADPKDAFQGEAGEFAVWAANLDDPMAKEAMARIGETLDSYSAQRRLTPGEETTLQTLAAMLAGQLHGKRHLIHGLGAMLLKMAND
ncbi:MAG TPA: hypothetical protein VFO38_01505 [Candidatus Saccharimonadales bacterium]|nr:hypothetical protein [Candidatus Saccharimonadales bacterium]